MEESQHSGVIVKDHHGTSQKKVFSTEINQQVRFECTIFLLPHGHEKLTFHSSS